MARPTAFRGLLWLTGVCAMLASPVAAATGTLTADFDGDGNSDWVTIDRAEPSVLHVWLSASGTTASVRSRRPVLQIAARDVDGDHLPELITTEAGSWPQWKRAHTLRVWKQDARRGFRTFHSRHRTPGTLKAPSGTTLDEDPPADDSTDGDGAFVPGRDTASSRAPAVVGPQSISRYFAASADAALASHIPLDQSAPRAPPVRHLPDSLLA